MTNGEKLVGLQFNPSGLTEVDEVKQTFAKMIDKLEDKFANSVQHGTATANREFLFNYAKQELIRAQMAMVKYLTFD